MIAITTSNSMSVKPLRSRDDVVRMVILSVRMNRHRDCTFLVAKNAAFVKEKAFGRSFVNDRAANVRDAPELGCLGAP